MGIDITNTFKKKFDKRIPQTMCEKGYYVGHIRSDDDRLRSYKCVIIWAIPGQDWITIGYLPRRFFNFKKYVSGKWLLNNLEEVYNIHLDHTNFHETEFSRCRNTFMKHINEWSPELLQDWNRHHQPPYIHPVKSIDIY